MYLRMAEVTYHAFETYLPRRCLLGAESGGPSMSIDKPSGPLLGSVDCSPFPIILALGEPHISSWRDSVTT